MIQDPVSNVQRTYSQMSPREAHMLNVLLHSTPSFISGASLMPDGARLLLPQTGQIVIAVYDKEPGSIIPYAIRSREYEDWIADMPNRHEGSWNSSAANSLAPSFSASQSFGSLYLDYIHYGSYGGSEDASLTISALFTDPKSSPHLRVSFEDESLTGGKVSQKTKSSVTCYFAKQFHALRKKCCLSEVNFVTVIQLKGGKETKMHLVVMENLFFKRSISRVYDLKGSLRSRYNTDTTRSDKVLLDLNLLETLGTKPILFGSKAKRRLERPLWNDTSFLASVDVMDYSLLVEVDDERKELVIGIIDFMRQYTWDKHLETWVKASGILGGPKNASPTIISPKQYKRRFRKVMTSYFLTVPDQWSW
ncbi:hypothetical protein RHGRI_026752 [Rhododendron griersonianum]|uniref:PIPK domain-containing protein n=1 Tax=Rhododendron griersonianum TaxID=479676 RepID=A0AAV6ITS8_9ERIC|nr:hypothetical protein RHGRI_026752 [Rhododendron griersonianum]